MATFDERMALLRRAYDAFNRRDIGTALSMLDPEVDWPNLLEGTVIHGHRAVSEYWERQFQLISSQVEPTAFIEHGDLVIVDVHQIVHDLQTDQTRDQHVAHTFTFRGDLVLRLQLHATVEEARK